MESQIPVMLMAFIRPDLIAKCLHQLSKFKPPILYVMADGPRNEKEEILCEKIELIRFVLQKRLML